MSIIPGKAIEQKLTNKLVGTKETKIAFTNGTIHSIGEISNGAAIK